MRQIEPADDTAAAAQLTKYVLVGLGILSAMVAVLLAVTPNGI